MKHDMQILRDAMNISKRLTPSDVHVDRPLTNISVAYMQDQSNFVADRIFPRVSVQKQSDQYWIYDRSYWNRSEMRKRPPSTETPGGGMKFSLDNYFCDVYGLHMDIDDRVVANADSPLAPRAEASEWVTRQGLLFREIEWMANYFQPGIWAQTEIGAAAPAPGSFVFWDNAAADPVGDVKRWKTQMHLASGGFRPNVMVMSRMVYDALTESPAIIDRIKYGQTPGAPAMVSKQNIAALFELDRIEILDSIQNTAPELAPIDAEQNEYIAGNHVALYYVPSSAGLRTPSAGYTFVWSGYLGANNGQRISSFRMDNIRSDRIEIELTFSHKIVGQDLGFFGENALT